MKPILLAVDDNPDALGHVERDLHKRYGADYEIIAERSPAVALSRLKAVSQVGEPVALLLAAQWMPEMTGLEFLTQAHQLHASAKRVLLIDVGDVTAEQPIARALTLNQLDFYIGQPWASPEEEFYPVTGEALRDWARVHLPRYEKVKIVAARQSPRARQLRNWLERNTVACGSYLVDSPEGRELLNVHGVDADRLPVLILYDGRILVEPTEEEIAVALGGRTRPEPGRYDVAIVGAGPAGLAAAVYGASEGLRTVVLEGEAIGGQAGTSSAIRNYLGFTWGVGGRDLTERANRQATGFGAHIAVTHSAIALRSRGENRVLTLSNGDEIVSRTVVIATGVSYRRLEAPGVEPLVGAGIFYGAPLTEAQGLHREQVYLIGGGNSAGQAAVHLANYAARVTILVRSTSLAKSMSDYLIREIEAQPNIEVRFSTQVVGAQGDRHLERLVLADAETGAAETVPAAALFILIGAEPHTDWLAGVLARDSLGYLLTGRDLALDGQQPESWPLDRPPFLLETSLPGVFAAGDVRHRSMKRVASAVGEGATAIQVVHEYLRER